MKKIVSLTLVIAMVMTVFVLPVSARTNDDLYDGRKVNTYYYKNTNNSFRSPLSFFRASSNEHISLAQIGLNEESSSNELSVYVSVSATADAEKIGYDVEFQKKAGSDWNGIKSASKYKSDEMFMSGMHFCPAVYGTYRAVAECYAIINGNKTTITATSQTVSVD